MSASILFYGINLGAPEDDGWAIKGGDQDFEPDWIRAWYQDADGNDVDYYLRRAILMANGVSDEEIITGDPEALLADRCSLKLVTFGHYNTLFYGLAIASLVHEADDWSPTFIEPAKLNTNLDFPDPDLLYRALAVLGMVTVQREATWILAPQE